MGFCPVYNADTHALELIAGDCTALSMVAAPLQMTLLHTRFEVTMVPLVLLTAKFGTASARSISCAYQQSVFIRHLPTVSALGCSHRQFDLLVGTFPGKLDRDVTDRDEQFLERQDFREDHGGDVDQVSPRADVL